MTRDSVLDRMRGVSVLAIATDLGFRTTPPRGASGGAFAPCPSCSAERRHTRNADRRLACGVRRDGLGFRCFQCDAAGDAISLVAMTIGGGPIRTLPRHRLDDVLDWCERFLGGGAPPRIEHRAKTADRVAPQLLSETEARRFWESCIPVTDDSVVAEFLRNERGIDPAKVAQLDLARALRVDAPSPPWASFRDFWSRTDRRLVVPMFDANGSLRSFRARLVRAPRDGEPKSVGPTGMSCIGCIFANRVCQHLLSGERSACSRVLVAEGEMDAIAASIVADDLLNDLAVLGIVQGSFTSDIAARIPPLAHVVVATHHDEQGDKYAASVRRGLRPEQRVSRALPADRGRV